MDQDVDASTPKRSLTSRGPATPAERVASRFLLALDYLFALAPILAIGALYAASWRAMTLIGHWPLPYVDDPNSVGGDPVYGLFSGPFIPFTVLAEAGVVMLPLLTLVLRRRYRLVALAVPFAVYVLGLALAVLDVGDRIAWYMD